MNLLGYVVMAFGASLAIVGIFLFSKRGAEGTSAIKAFRFEFQLGGSALVIFVLGVFVFLVPFIYPAPFSPDRTNDDNVSTLTIHQKENPAPTTTQQTVPGQADTATNLPQQKIDPGPLLQNRIVPSSSLHRHPNQSGITERVHKIIEEQLGIKVVPDASTYTELGADELDCVEMTMAFEDAFDLEIPDDDLKYLCKSTVNETVSYISNHVHVSQVPH